MITDKIRNNPVAFSIVSALIISAIWAGVSLFTQGLARQIEIQVLMLITSAINIAFTIIGIALLGIANQSNGFKHVLKAKGFIKGLIVLIPVMLFFILNLTYNIGGIADTGTESISIFLTIAFMQMTSAFMANVIFRGLLVTALFVKLSSTQNERVKSIFKASALYLIIYIPINMIDSGNIEFMQLVNTLIVGAGFCAAYLYSKNLMSLVFVQGVWQISGSVINLITAPDYPQFTLITFIGLVAILISIVAFAIVFGKRATPFVLHAPDTPYNGV